MTEDLDLTQTRAAAVMLLHSLARRLLVRTVEPTNKLPEAADDSRQATLYDLVKEFEKVLAFLAERQQPSGEICCICGQPAIWRVQATPAAEFCTCDGCLGVTKSAARYLFGEAAEITVERATVRNVGGAAPCPP